MSKGIVRKIDWEGRVVIPFELRNTFDIHPMDEVDIYCSHTQIIIEPHKPHCIFCGHPTEKFYKGKGICQICQESLYDGQY